MVTKRKPNQRKGRKKAKAERAARNNTAAVKIADVMHAVPPKAPRPRTSWQVLVDFLRGLRG